MRWFLGIPVPIETARDLVARAADSPVSMDRARRLVAEDLHLTLRFFGEIGQARVAALGTAMLPMQREAFRLELAGVGAFRSVGAVYASVVPSSELAALAEAVNEALAWHGFPRELRPFHPHITLARVRRAPPQAELEAWSERWLPLRFVADRIALFHSLAESPSQSEVGRRRYDVAQTFHFSEPARCNEESP